MSHICGINSNGMMFLPGPAPKHAVLGPALLGFASENHVAEIIADPISHAGKVHSRTSEMDSSQSWEKLIVLLRQGAPEVLYLQVEARAPVDIMGVR